MKCFIILILCILVLQHVQGHGYGKKKLKKAKKHISHTGLDDQGYDTKYQPSTTEQPASDNFNWDNYDDLDNNFDDGATKKNKSEDLLSRLFNRKPHNFTQGYDSMYQPSTTEQPVLDNFNWDNYDDLDNNFDDDDIWGLATTSTTPDYAWDMFKTVPTIQTLPSDFYNPPEDLETYNSYDSDSSDSGYSYTSYSYTAPAVGGVGGIVVLIIFLRLMICACRMQRYSRNQSATNPNTLRPTAATRVRAIAVTITPTGAQKSGEDTKQLITPERV